MDTVVSPDTLLRWYRRLIAEKWNFVHRHGPGRPAIMQQISALIVHMAQDNPGPEFKGRAPAPTGADGGEYPVLRRSNRRRQRRSAGSDGRCRVAFARLK
jgi:hypothetical protein